MNKRVSRRSIVKGAAGAGAIGAASSRFFAPSLISAQGSDIELTYYTAFGSGTNGDAQTRVIEEFNAMDNGITVSPTTFTNYAEVANAILTGLDSGDVPDMFTVSEVWWFTFYLRQSLVDLTGLLDDPDDYVDSLFVEYQRNGGQWAVPFARSTPLMYLNTDAFEAAGLDISVASKWSDFAEVADQLVQGDVKFSFGFNNAAGYAAWTLHGAIWAFEGNYSDPDLNILVNEPNAVATGEFMRDMVQNKGASVLADINTEFSAGSVAAVFQSTGTIGTMTEQSLVPFVTAELPSEMSFGCPTGGAGLAVVDRDSDERAAAAAEFLKYSTSTEVSSTWAQTTGYMPSRKSAVETPEFQAFLEENPNNAVAIGQLEKTQPQDSARVFLGNGDTILGTAWEQILVNDVPAQEAFDEAARILDDEKKPVIEAIQAIEG